MAVRDYIKVSPNAAGAGQAMSLVNFKNSIATILAQGPLMLDIMNHNFDDSNPQAIVWTDLETLYGLPAGSGQTVFDMVNGIMGALTGTMQNSQAVSMVSRIG